MIALVADRAGPKSAKYVIAVHVASTRAGWACVDRIAEMIVSDLRYGATVRDRMERAAIVREYSRVLPISGAMETCDILGLDPYCHAWDYGEPLPELPL